MAKIPLAQIPRTPETPVLAGPTVVNTGGISSAFGRVAAAQQQETMPLDAFSGEAKGIGAIGSAVQDIGAMAARMAAFEQEKKDEIDQADARERVLNEISEHQNSLKPGGNPDEWEQSFKDRVADIESRSIEVARSSRSRDAIRLQTQHLLGQYGRQLRSQAQKETWERAKTGGVQMATQLFKSGNPEGGEAQLNKLVSDGLMDEIEAEGQKISLKAQASLEAWMMESNNRPLEVLSQKERPENLDEGQWLRVKKEAKAASARIGSDYYERGMSAILDGKMSSKESLEAFLAGPDADLLSATQRLSLNRNLSQAQKDKPEDLEKLRSDILAYRSSVDPTLEAKHDLKARIDAYVSEGNRGDFTQLLQEVSGDRFRGGTKSIMYQMAKSAVDLEFPKDEQRKGKDYFLRLAPINEKIDAWLKANPGAKQEDGVIEVQRLLQKETSKRDGDLWRSYVEGHSAFFGGIPAVRAIRGLLPRNETLRSRVDSRLSE